MNVLKITFEVTDHQDFFKKKLTAINSEIDPEKWFYIGWDQKKAKPISSRYYCIEPVISRNRVIYPYQEGKFQRNRLYLSRHFHLAFQGGGAKGLAYVGAYR